MNGLAIIEQSKNRFAAEIVALMSPGGRDTAVETQSSALIIEKDLAGGIGSEALRPGAAAILDNFDGGKGARRPPQIGLRPSVRLGLRDMKYDAGVRTHLRLRQDARQFVQGGPGAGAVRMRKQKKDRVGWGESGPPRGRPRGCPRGVRVPQ